MTFDDLIEKNEEYLIDACETWFDSDKTAACVDTEDCSIDLLEWYLGLIIRSV